MPAIDAVGGGELYLARDLRGRRFWSKRDVEVIVE